MWGKKIKEEEHKMTGIRKDVRVCAAVRSGGTGLGRGTRNACPCSSCITRDILLVL